MEFIILLVLVVIILLAESILYKKNWDKKLHYECKFSVDEAYEGDEIELLEILTNGKALPLPWTKTEITTSANLEFANSSSVVSDKTRFVPSFFMLKSYHRVTRRWKVKCLRRGEYGIDHIVLVSTDPLGHSTFSMPIKADSKLTVLPRPLDNDEYLIKPSGLTGEIVVPRKLISDPFIVAGVREYTKYDPANRIHWAASARQGEIMVRNNDYTSDQNVTVVMNMQTRFDEGRRLIDPNCVENAISVAATYLDATIPLGIPVRLMANGGMPGSAPLATGLGNGQEFILDLLRVLARLEVTKSESFMSYLDTTQNDIMSTDIIIITPYVEEGMFDFARERAMRGVKVRFLLTRPHDETLLPDDCDFLQFLVKDHQFVDQVQSRATEN